jgi:hypothetical protein
MKKNIPFLKTAVATICLCSAAFAAEFESQVITSQEFAIFDDYSEAYRAAQAERRMLLIYFQKDRGAATDQFESQVLLSEEVGEKLRRFVVARLPLSAGGVVQGKTIRFLDHPAFAEMKRCPGVAIVDLTDSASRHYGHVVSIYPFKAGRTLTRQHFAELVSLPAGSLTQRTLIFAVRVHPENPVSADSRLIPLLAAETESHARYQAQLGVQGHHDWDTRFQRINSRTGLTAQEVCAESWPGQDLVDAAFECVHSWRQSPGHWSAVRGRNTYFGYDMKRGHNGIWYGAGIFARR